MTSRAGYLLFLLFLASCLGMDRRGGILKISGGEVYTGTGRFTVGKLSPDWKGPKIKLKQMVFENDRIGATIVTDALCGPKFDEAPLSHLLQDLFRPMEKRNVGKLREVTVDGRRALRAQGEGNLDGVPLRMEAVVVKKDFCLYDFVYFAPPERFPEGARDFEEYLHGFRVR